jgi:hypothetical protein
MPNTGNGGLGKASVFLVKVPHGCKAFHPSILQTSTTVCINRHRFKKKKCAVTSLNYYLFIKIISLTSHEKPALVFLFLVFASPEQCNFYVHGV